MTTVAVGREVKALTVFDWQLASKCPWLIRSFPAELAFSVPRRTPCGEGANLLHHDALGDVPTCPYPMLGRMPIFWHGGRGTVEAGEGASRCSGGSRSVGETCKTGPGERITAHAMRFWSPRVYDAEHGPYSARRAVPRSGLCLWGLFPRSARMCTHPLLPHSTCRDGACRAYWCVAHAWETARERQGCAVMFPQWRRRVPRPP